MLRIRSRLLVPAALGLLLALPGEAKAGFITIQNASFEKTVTGDYTSNGADGWTLLGSGGGVWNINSSPLGFWNENAPEGNQIGYLSPAPSGGPASYSQVLGDVLLTDTFYSLTGYVGHPIGYGTTYTVELLAGNNVLATINGTGPEGSFEQFQLTFDSTGSAFVGKTLQIRLSSSEAQTGFDAISLDAQVRAAPEPSGLVMISTGALTLLGYGSRRRGRLTPTETTKPSA